MGLAWGPDGRGVTVGWVPSVRQARGDTAVRRV